MTQCSWKCPTCGKPCSEEEGHEGAHRCKVGEVVRRMHDEGEQKDEAYKKGK